MKGDHIEVVIVTRNSAGHIGQCVDSVVAAGGLPIVVDNGSTDDTLDIVRSRSREARVVAAGENLGYGKAINLGFRETSGDIVILSNPDVVYLDGSISLMSKFLEDNLRIGVTGPQQMFPNRKWQRSYGELPGIWSGIMDATGWTTLHNGVRKFFWPRRLDRKAKIVPYVDGAVLAVRRQAFLEMGGFDEDFYFYSDESDLCARLTKAGWGVVFFPKAQVIHVRGADSAKVERSDRFVRHMVKSQALLASKHLPAWKARLYAKFQICHFARLGLMYRVAQWFGQPKPTTAYKIWMADTSVRIWKEFSACTHLINPKGPDEKRSEREETEKAN